MAAALPTPAQEHIHEQFEAPALQNADGCRNGHAVSLIEYLNTAYHPDCDYINGHLQERNWGEFDHALSEIFPTEVSS